MSDATANPEVWDLETLRAARRLGDFMFAQFAPYVGPVMAEIGAGIGTFSERLLTADVERLLLIEPDSYCVDALRRDFSGDPRVTIADELLPEAPTLAAWAGQVDYVLCQNVLEHIEDDAAAVRAMAASLRPGGRITVLVPANPRLYGALDRAYGHHRRYTRDRLASVTTGAGLVIDDLHFFNLLGVPGWIVQRNRRTPGLSRSALRIYELLLRAWEPIERRYRPPTGLSVIVQAHRPAE